VFETGRCLSGRFEITEFLGAGGLGEVYRAYDSQQHIFIAVKTLRPGLISDRTALDLLRNELNMARCVTHENVCRLHDVHWTNNAGEPPFFTMELLEGETLAAHIARCAPLDPSRMEPLVRQMLDGLEAAHEKGIVHRDFKSANVMLTEDGRRVKIMDFGLARETQSGADLQSTLATNSFAGTPAYMAPEQLRGRRATFGSDIHALGVVMYEMAAGRRPFIGATPLEVASCRLNQKPPSPREFVPDLDRRWEYAILRCLEEDPAKRPASAAAVRELLATRPPVLWMRRRTVIAAGVGTLVIAAAAGVNQGVRFFRSRSAVSPTTNGVAMDHYARARYLLEEASPASTRAALPYLQQAIAEDPKFALAWSALADANLSLAAYENGAASTLTREAGRCAQEAIRLDPALAEAHATLAAVRQHSFDWTGAEQSYLEALRLKPSFSRAHRWYAGFLLQFARFDETIQQIQLALKYDPYDQLGPMDAGMFLLFAGRPADAIAIMEPAVEGKELEGTRHNLGESYARMGQLSTGAARGEWFKKAFEQADTVATIERRRGRTRPLLSDRMYVLFRAISGEDTSPFLGRLTEDMENGKFSPANLAWVYAIQHNYPIALDLLDRAYKQNLRSLMYIKVNPFLENLHSQPRFEQLVRTLRL
jgi:tetratricopeptide (TPR) repeat protein